MAQVLVNKSDFANTLTLQYLKSTLNELLELNIVPILNTNDAMSPPTEGQLETHGIISVNDNDSLAAQLARLIKSDLLVIMSNVNGLYNNPHNQAGAHLLHTFKPSLKINVQYGEKSDAGIGGMESKIEAASWALERKCSVVICNGQRENAIVEILNGKRIGTFFTDSDSCDNNPDSMKLQAVKGEALFSI